LISASVGPGDGWSPNAPGRATGNQFLGQQGKQLGGVPRTWDAEDRS
jgi:hypothetical protein